MSGQAVSRGPAPCGKSKGFSEGRPALPYCMCMHQHSARRRAEFAGRAGPRGDAGTAAPGWEKRSGTDANSRRRNRRKPMRKPYHARPPRAEYGCILNLIYFLNSPFNRSVKHHDPRTCGLGTLYLPSSGRRGARAVRSLCRSQVNIVIACRPACQLFAGLNRALGRCVCNASYCSVGNHEPSKGE